jgi:hypothetical protein
MTEQEWLVCTDPRPMLEFLRGKAGERKLGLFTCACCRRISRLMKDERGSRAVEVLEQCVDGPEKDPDWQRAGGGANDAWATASCACWAAYSTNSIDRPEHVASNAATAMVWAKTRQGEDRRVARATEQAQLCRLLRDLFGNPFQPAVFDPAWRTPDLTTLAGHIYCDRSFKEMPALADALEEAGCTDAEILAHCRQPGEHVRGCWVVDAVLGKE